MKSILKNPKFGSSCMFVRLGRGVGLKLYETANERNYAYTRQFRASQLGLGPMVYGKLSLNEWITERPWASLRSYTQRYRYGYLTQTATVCRSISSQKLKGLTRRLTNHGFSTRDICSNNVGLIKDKLVCIDFDRASMD